MAVQTIDRAIALLSAFSAARPVASVSYLADATGLTKSTAHRLLSSLVEHGLVAQLSDSTDYCLGPRLLGLADTAKSQLSLQLQAEAPMRALRDYTGETVGLHVMDQIPMRRTIAQVESTKPLRRTYVDMGSPIAPHLGSPGKVLLAFAPQAVLEKVMAGDLRDGVSGVRIETEDLRAELDQVRSDEYAVSLEGRVLGVASIAVPVRDYSGTVVAALSVSVPSVRADTDSLIALAPRIFDAALELSRQLGYRPA